MPKLYVLVGIPASGKTACAHMLSASNNIMVHEYDHVKRSLNNTKDYELISETWFDAMRTDLLLGFDIVCDSTNLTRESRLDLLQIFSDIECEKITIVMNTPIQECLDRNREREYKVADFAIRLAHDMLEIPTETEGWDEIRIISNN